MTSDPIPLAELHLDLLYERSPDGLLLRSRDPHVAAPLLHLVRTVSGNRWSPSRALEDRRQEIEGLLASEPPLGEPSESEPSPPELRRVLQLLSEPGLDALTRGPAFCFGEPPPDEPGPAELLANLENAATVPELAWIKTLTRRENPVAVARNQEGVIVSVCHSARSTAAGAEAGVETATGYRGLGLAGAVVRRWAAAVQAEGRLPLYSTDWQNGASRAVASELGLSIYGEDCRLTPATPVRT